MDTKQGSKLVDALMDLLGPVIAHTDTSGDPDREMELLMAIDVAMVVMEYRKQFHH